MTRDLCVQTINNLINTQDYKYMIELFCTFMEDKNVPNKDNFIKVFIKLGLAPIYINKIIEDLSIKYKLKEVYRGNNLIYVF